MSQDTPRDTPAPDHPAPEAPVPDDPVPDDKDWTWVLERPCPECGFDASTLDPSAVADLVRSNASDWQRVLAGPDVRRRPAPALAPAPVPDQFFTLCCGT